MLPEERVMYTMELQSDISVQIDKHAKHDEEWKTLAPAQDNEKSEMADVSIGPVGRLQPGCPKREFFRRRRLTRLTVNAA